MTHRGAAGKAGTAEKMNPRDWSVTEELLKQLHTLESGIWETSHYDKSPQNNPAAMEGTLESRKLKTMLKCYGEMLH